MGIEVDAHLRAADRLWAVGDVTGVRLLTHVGKYQGEVVAANILGEPREARYEAIPDAIHTDPQAASVGATQARFTATAQLSEVAKTATYTHAYASSNGFLTLLTDGDHLTGAYALGPEAGEWLQQATLAIRARVPIEVLRDVIQPFPTFSEIYVDALKALHGQITATHHPPPRDRRETRRDTVIDPDTIYRRNHDHRPAVPLASANPNCPGDRRRDRRAARHRPGNRPPGPRRGRRASS